MPSCRHVVDVTNWLRVRRSSCDRVLPTARRMEIHRRCSVATPKRCMDSISDDEIGTADVPAGHVGIILEDDDSAAPGYFGNLCVTSMVGLPTGMQSLVQPAISQLAQRKYDDVSENVIAGVSTLWQHMQQQGWVTVAGNQIADTASYHASPFYQDFRKQIDCDDFVVSIRVVDLPRRPEGRRRSRCALEPATAPPTAAYPWATPRSGKQFPTLRRHAWSASRRADPR